MRYTEDERREILRKWGFSTEPLSHPLAEKTLARIAAAIELGTVHRHRLQTLHDRLSRELELRDADLVDMWLADYGAAINAEIIAAFNTFEHTLAQASIGIPTAPHPDGGRPIPNPDKRAA